MENSERPIKILHLGDVFLDCPFSSMRAEDSAARRRETRETFLRAVKYASEEEIDLVLISGNLTDSHYATFDTLELLGRAFASAPKCRFLITPPCMTRQKRTACGGSVTSPRMCGSLRVSR